MTTRLNHENLSFKSWGKETETCGVECKQIQSIQELQKEIDECELCQNLKGYCHWHQMIIDGDA